MRGARHTPPHVCSRHSKTSHTPGEVGTGNTLTKVSIRIAMAAVGSHTHGHSPHGDLAMPPVSQAQRSAMRAAASGKSTLGIPKSVGADFSAADPGGKLPRRNKAKKKKSKAPKKSNFDFLAPRAGKDMM